MSQSGVPSSAELQLEVERLTRERDAALEAAQAATEERNENLRRYRRIFERSKDVIIVSTPTGDLIDINQAGLDLYDYPSKETMQALDLKTTLWAHPEDREEYVRQLGEFGFVKDFEADHKTRTGEIISVVGTSSIVYGPDGSIQELLTILRDISEQKQLSRELERLARTDSLTSLSNRLVFRERLELVLAEWRRHQKSFALMMLDIDNLKQVNDAHGHPAGDDLLKGVADRFSKCVREVDVLARFGGDEFALIMAEVQETARAEEMAHRLVSSLHAPISTTAGPLHTSVSVGIALPIGNPTPDQLLQRADRSLYRAKGRGGNQYAI